MSTPTNSGSTKPKSALKKFGDRFAFDCALLQEGTKGIKKKDQKKKKKITSCHSKIDNTNKKNKETKAPKMEMKMKEEDAEQEDSQHYIRILKASNERLEEENLFQKIKISTLEDQIKKMEESKIEEKRAAFPRVRIVEMKVDEDGDPDMEEFRMPREIFKGMPDKWQSFVKNEIAKGKKTAHMHCCDLGEHFEAMMGSDEDDDVSDEDIENALMTFDKMWDYGEEDEKGERDYAYREDNWEDGFDVTFVVNRNDRDFG